MTILSAYDISKFYGVNKIFDGVNFKIDSKDKIGIVGVNGAGKTTLFRLLTCQEESDSGTIAREKSLAVAYMEQNSDYTSEKTAEQEVIQIFQELEDEEHELETITKQLEQSQEESLIKRFNILTEHFVDNGGMTYKNRVRATLLGLGFLEDELVLPLYTLSGGQRTRVLLAKVLLSNAGLLLLDEPTNHLDIEATQWLEDFLLNYKNAVVVISHDRFFLDKICNKTFEIENHKLTIYGGNYTYYKDKKAFDKLSAERVYEEKQKEIKRIEDMIAQQKRFNQARNYVTIRSKQKQLDRIEDSLEKPEKDPAEIKFTFKCCGEAANEVLLINNLSKKYSEKVLFKNVDLLIKNGDKAFLSGNNGCGKTTLFKIILNQCSSDSGNIKIGSRVRVGYYDQTLSNLNDNNTVFDEILNEYPKMTNTQIRSALGSFLFKGDDVFKKVEALSGGEKARVLLVKLILSQTNFLLLDEPTNHLDIASKEVLERALAEYDGTLLIVSHDRYFINTLANKIFFMNENMVKEYDGNYEYFISKTADLPVKKTEKPEKVNSYIQRKSDLSEKRKAESRAKRLEKSIKEKEGSITELEALLAEPEIAGDYVKLTDITYNMQIERAELEKLYEEWMEYNE